MKHTTIEPANRRVYVDTLPTETYQGIVIDQTDATITLTDWSVQRISSDRPRYESGHGPIVLPVNASTLIVDEVAA